MVGSSSEAPRCPIGLYRTRCTGAQETEDYHLHLRSFPNGRFQVDDRKISSRFPFNTRYGIARNSTGNFPTIDLKSTVWEDPKVLDDNFRFPGHSYTSTFDCSPIQTDRTLLRPRMSSQPNWKKSYKNSGHLRSDHDMYSVVCRDNKNSK